MNRRLPVFLLLLFWVTLGGCREDNGLKDQIAESELLLPYARYLNLDVNYSTRSGGAINPTLSSSQAFDTGYWGWRTGGSTVVDSSTSLTFVENWTQPLPTQSFEETYVLHFADLTWPRAYAHTGVVRPKAISSISYQDYTSANVNVTSATPDTYQVSYDTSTGLISTAVQTKYDTSGSISTKEIWTFASDPRDYSEYYQASYAVYTGDALTSAGSQAQAIEVSTSGNNEFETYTYRNYNSSGTLANFSYSSFGTKNGSTVVKWVEEVGYYQDATTDVSADSIITTKTYFSDETTEVYKTVEQAHYEDIETRVPISITNNTYTISGGTETLYAKSVENYTDGLLSTALAYTVSSGTASLNTTTTYTRNSRGQPTQVEIADSTDTVYYRTYYTYDDSHRLLTLRNHSVDSADTETCASGNYDLSYQTTTNDANETIYLTTQLNYGCTGSVIDTTPSSRKVTTYDQNFMPTLVQTYSYSSGAYTLATQTGYSYNSDHQLTRTQTYAVSLGIATESNYTEYTYDSNGFQTSAVEKNTFDIPTSNYRFYTYTYR